MKGSLLLVLTQVKSEMCLLGQVHWLLTLHIMGECVSRSLVNSLPVGVYQSAKSLVHGWFTETLMPQKTCVYTPYTGLLIRFPMSLSVYKNARSFINFTYFHSCHMSSLRNSQVLCQCHFQFHLLVE